jgi:hypothetical protein
VTTTETRRPTTGHAKPNDRASVGAQPLQAPHPTRVSSKPTASTSGGDPNIQQATVHAEPIAGSPAGPSTHPTRLHSKPNKPTSGGSNASRGQEASDDPAPMPPAVLDPGLALAADILDDVEKVWVANGNRLRILTTPRDQADKDGECRGFGLTENDPDVARLAAMVDTLEKLTGDATKHLEKVLRRHPLHPWINVQRGLGDKQVARLLAAIGDPYWNSLHNRPRTVSELWAYAGFHVVPASHGAPDTQKPSAGRGQAGGGDTSHHSDEPQGILAGVAPRRRRGQQSNWNETARKRAWLVAKSIVKQLCRPCKDAGSHIAECACSPYRVLYDATKAKYANAVHTSPCAQCGPAGKPAAIGTPLKPGHIDARGLRAISKAALKDLWIEARRLHGDAQDGAR